MSNPHAATHLLFAKPTGPLTARSCVAAVNRSNVERLAVRQRFKTSPCVQTRLTPTASSLDDSKKRARSKYDNIPDLNEQYIAELAWVERNYGPKSLRGKDVAKEAQKSILADSSRFRPSSNPSANAPNSVGSPKNSDLGSYIKVRQRLLSDTLFVGVLGLCATWTVGQFRDVVSFAVGIGAAIIYVWLLSRSVDRMAETARETGRGGGDPLQAARVALFAILIIATARNADRFSVVSVILGFLTFKAASILPLLTGEAFE